MDFDTTQRIWPIWLHPVGLLERCVIGIRDFQKSADIVAGLEKCNLFGASVTFLNLKRLHRAEKDSCSAGSKDSRIAIRVL